MIVAKYIGDIGAVGGPRASVLGANSTAGHTLGKRKLAKPSPLVSSNTGLPGAFSAPKTIASAGRSRAAASAPAMSQYAPPAPKTSVLSKRNNVPPASSSTSSSSSSSYAADSGAAYAPPSSSSGGGTPWPIDTPIASAGDEVPVRDAYVSVSGGIPDGAVYAIMAATAGALAYVLWRRSKRR
jgi:hypothetical protein